MDPLGRAGSTVHHAVSPGSTGSALASLLGKFGFISTWAVATQDRPHVYARMSATVHTLWLQVCTHTHIHIYTHIYIYEYMFIHIPICMYR